MNNNNHDNSTLNEMWNNLNFVWQSLNLKTYKTLKLLITNNLQTKLEKGIY